MSDDFLDSNVILYSFDEDDRKSSIAGQLLASALGGNACISFQVVQEVLNLLTRRGNADPFETRRFMRDVLLPLWIVMPSGELYDRAMSIQSRFGYHFYDSLIIAAALEAGCRRLLTEDMQHGQRIDGLLIENPFR